MSHLDFDRIFELMGDSGSAEEKSHLADCDVCRRQLELWRTRLEDLREIESNTVSTAEIHNLRVLFRELGPSPAARSWIARLIRRSEPAAAGAVRGGLAATFEAYEAGPYQIVLQVSPSETEGRFDLQGQVAGDGSRVPVSTQVVLTSERGYADRATVDAFGEFRIAGVPEGQCRLVWCGGGERIQLDGLDFRECDDDDGS
jgi:hypothetical protein